MYRNFLGAKLTYISHLSKYTQTMPKYVYRALSTRDTTNGPDKKWHFTSIKTCLKGIKQDASTLRSRISGGPKKQGGWKIP